MALSHTRHQLNCAHMRDEIGQVYNYRYFIKRLNETIALSRRHHMPVSCIVLDIAFYRVLVDSYGYGFVSGPAGAGGRSAWYGPCAKKTWWPASATAKLVFC
ncbi:MAG: diguanylate cyclase [Vampirovibrionales bacterium]